MRKLICTLLAAAFVTASLGATAFAAETDNTTAAEMTAAQEETTALISGEYAVDISWTPMAGMISPILDIDAENMTFNLYNASAPETSKGSGSISYADGIYTMIYSDGNTTTFTYAENTITFTSKLFYGTASFDQTDDNGNFVSYTATVNTGDTTETPESTDTTESTEGTDAVTGSGTLVCYMPAMGGCNLSENLVENISCIDNADGSVTITLDFYEVGEWSSMYFDGQTTYVADTGQIAYYDGSAWVNVEYTTAVSSDGSYTYVDTMTFTAAEKTETYDLAMYMSDYQFGGDTPSTVSSGEQMTATLTMSWESDTEEPTETTTAVTENTTTETTTTTVTTTEAATESTASTTETASASKQISISSLDELDAGTYQLTASLSCWMSAMGGCDFGKDLLKSAVLTVGTDGSKKITLYFYEMVDVVMAYGTASAYAENSGEIGYYNGSAWSTAEYTTASGTSEDGAYTYVNSMAFPISAINNTYDLALCIGGTQFGGESARMLSDGSVLAATLSVDWTKAYTNVKVSSNGTVTNAGDSTASPQTGDNVPLAAGIAMLVSAGTAVLLYKKKSER